MYQLGRGLYRRIRHRDVANDLHPYVIARLSQMYDAGLHHRGVGRPHHNLFPLRKPW